jgi:acetylornithine deacetylase/succinyl-diaminopimelate desuccinylase-like protein
MPGSTEADLHALVAAAVGDDIAYELEVLEPLEGGTESPIDTPLFAACEAFVRETVPGAEILPVIGAGFSDSYFVRREWGTTAYGFAPVFSTDIELYTAGFHAADERLDVADLVTMSNLASHAIDSLSRASGRAVRDGRLRPR